MNLTKLTSSIQLTQCIDTMYNKFKIIVQKSKNILHLIILNIFLIFRVFQASFYPRPIFLREKYPDRLPEKR